MTPDKRATLLTAFKWSSLLIVATGLLVYGYIAPPEWLVALGVG
jgi:hypothetical protein